MSNTLNYPMFYRRQKRGSCLSTVAARPTLLASADTGPDNGATSCMHRYFDQSPFSIAKRHGTTNQAFANCRSAGMNSHFLLGHGMEGIIATGIGNDGTRLGEMDKFLANFNKSSWLSTARRGIPGSLVLLGCKTGAGWQGSDLLYGLAVATGRDVGAVTGDVFCGNGKWHNEGVEQWASPDFRPPPIDPPPPPAYSAIQKTDYLIFAEDLNSLSPVKSNSVRELSIFKRVYSGNRELRLKIENKQASDIASMANFSNLRRLVGRPAAFNTGYLELTYRKEKRLAKKRFRIYNNSILQDIEFSNCFYFATDTFIHILNTV